jgi:hypothetical protein
MQKQEDQASVSYNSAFPGNTFLNFFYIVFVKTFSVTFSNSNRLYLEITVFFIHFLWCSEVATQSIYFGIISFIFHFNCNTPCIQDILLFSPNYSLFISVFPIYFSLCKYISLYICISLYCIYLYTHTHIYIWISPISHV